MSSRIDDLPVEVQANIFSYLRHADLATLMHVSKSFHRLATPLLWRYIELHRSGWHEHFQHKDKLDYTESNVYNKSRNYIELPSDEAACSLLDDYCLPTDQFGYYYQPNERFIRFLRPFKDFIYPAQFSDENPYKHVKSLCLDINLSRYLEPDEHPTLHFWAIFSVFQNLESLELIVDWPYKPEDWDVREKLFSKYASSLPPLRKLRKLCLRGYIPQSFARWSLSYSEQLTILELSILDRPISSSLCYSLVNPPPIRKQDENPIEDIEDDGGEILWATEESDHDSDSEEDLSHEAVGPRALAICQSTDIPEKLKSLSTLILTRPAQSGMSEDGDGWRDPICCSIRSDKAILRDWIHLIRATRGTLQHLVLDQRPFCEEIETESTGPDEFLELYPYGSSFQRFKDIVVPVLLEDGEWPRLKSIRFYGFDVPDARKTKPHPRVYRRWPSQHDKEEQTFLPQVKERFEPLGVDVKSSLGRRMVFHLEEGTVINGDGLGGQLDLAE